MPIPECLHWPFCPGVFIAVLAFVAAAVAFRKDPGRTERAAWVFLFLALMCGEVWMMSIDRAKNNQIIGEEMSRFDENLNMLTGGDSFPRLELLSPYPPNGELLPTVLIQGNYPLHTTWMRLVDMRAFGQFKAKNKPPYSFQRVLTAGATVLTLGDLAPNSQMPLSNLHIDDKSDKFYTVQFGAMNGNWREVLHLRWVEGQWQEAIEVFDDLPGGKMGKVRFSHVSDQYPRVNGMVDWGVSWGE